VQRARGQMFMYRAGDYTHGSADQKQCATKRKGNSADGGRRGCAGFRRHATGLCCACASAGTKRRCSAVTIHSAQSPSPKPGREGLAGDGHGCGRILEMNRTVQSCSRC
jgi:hypothetical protein